MLDERLIAQIHGWCAQQPIRLCVLFGSQATGRTHAHSDVDLAVWPVESVDLGRELRWLRELEMLLDSAVNLVLVTPRLNPVLGFEIMRDGQVIFEEEPDFWALEAARLWHLYNDSVYLPYTQAWEELRKFAESLGANSNHRA